MSATSSAPNAPPPSIEGLAIVGRLGGGGQADVWWANDAVHRRQVAIKVFHADAEPTLFDRERKATGLLSSHEHVVHLYGSGELDDGRLYLLLEYADGGSLADHQAGEQEAIDCVLQVCQAIVSAHAQGVIHRDIKPENVLLFKRSDGSYRAKISDFGIAAVPGTATTTSVRGSTAYAPPELLAGQKTDERGDVYSLGATLFHTLAGRVPTIGLVASAADLNAETSNGVTSAVAPVWRVISKATQNDPAHRYATAADFKRALHDAQAATVWPSTSPPAATPSPSATPSPAAPPASPAPGSSSPPSAASAPSAPPAPVQGVSSASSASSAASAPPVPPAAPAQGAPPAPAPPAPAATPPRVAMPAPATSAGSAVGGQAPASAAQRAAQLAAASPAAQLGKQARARAAGSAASSTPAGARAARRPLWKVPVSLDSTRNIAGLAGGVGVAGLVLTGVLASGPGLALVGMGYLAGGIASHALGHD